MTNIIISNENLSNENLVEYISLMEIESEKITGLDISYNKFSDVELICNLK